MLLLNHISLPPGLRLLGNVLLDDCDLLDKEQTNDCRGSGWEYMVQIEGPITPECWEGVPSPGGQCNERNDMREKKEKNLFQRFISMLKQTAIKSHFSCHCAPLVIHSDLAPHNWFEGGSSLV